MKITLNWLKVLFLLEAFAVFQVIQWRYDPLYRFRNAVFFGGRDPTNFRPRAFFEEGYADQYIDKHGVDPAFHVISEHNVNINHTKIVAYSLYGSKQKYLNGMLHNIRVIPERMPGWTVRIYLNEKVPRAYVNILRHFKHVEVIEVYDPIVEPGNGAGTFWRFLAL